MLNLVLYKNTLLYRKKSLLHPQISFKFNQKNATFRGIVKVSNLQQNLLRSGSKILLGLVGVSWQIEVL